MLNQGQQRLKNLRFQRHRLAVTQQQAFCRIEAEGPDSAMVDIRMRPADSASSVASEPKALEGGRCALVVPDDQLEGQAVVVVLLDSGGTVLAQRFTTVAEDGE